MSELKESPKPKLSAGLLDYAQKTYSIKLTKKPKVLWGSRSLNLLLNTVDGRFVLRVHRDWITSGRLQAIQTAHKALNAADIPSADLKPTLTGETWTKYKNNLVELESYVENDGDMNTWERLEAGLPMLGRIHSIFKTLEVNSEGKHPVVANHIAPEDVQKLTKRAEARINQWGPDTKQLEFVAIVKGLAGRLETAESQYVGKLPHQLVHGDFWDNNVLFRNEKLVVVLDLDFMGERARIDDLALTLYYTNSMLGGDYLSDERIRKLSRLAELYDSGQDEPLTATERAALPLAIARTPLFMMRYIAMMESKKEAAKPMANDLVDYKWGLGLLDDLKHWQETFAK